MIVLFSDGALSKAQLPANVISLTLLDVGVKFSVLEIVYVARGVKLMTPPVLLIASKAACISTSVRPDPKSSTHT